VLGAADPGSVGLEAAPDQVGAEPLRTTRAIPLAVGKDLPALIELRLRLELPLVADAVLLQPLPEVS
jgi:hypothetical protein